MREGICIYSGHYLPKGTGITRVRSDGKAHLLANNKVSNFVSRKIKPRYIAWTQQARTILKKENVVKQSVISIPSVVKIVRGFPSVPASVLEERKERREKKDEKKGKEEVKMVDRGSKVRRSETRKKN